MWSRVKPGDLNTILHDENSKRVHIAINMHIQRAFIHYSLARQHLCNGYAERETKSMAKMKNFEAMKAFKQICSIPVYLLKNIMLKSNTYGISELKLYILEHFNENKHILILCHWCWRHIDTQAHIHTIFIAQRFNEVLLSSIQTSWRCLNQSI